MTNEGDYDTVTLTAASLLRGADKHLAILLTGHRRVNEPYSVAIDLTPERIQLLRVQLDKAELLLTNPGGFS